MLKHDKNIELVDDSGVHEDLRVKQITIFVALCRIVTVILIILGVATLVYGNI